MANISPHRAQFTARHYNDAKTYVRLTYFDRMPDHSYAAWGHAGATDLYDTCFDGAIHPKGSIVTFDDAQLADIRNYTYNTNENLKTLQTCQIVVDYAFRDVFTTQLCCLEFGRYVGSDVVRRYRRRKRYLHWWLRFEDGTILDPTANQFGESDPVRILRLNNPLQEHYEVFPVVMNRSISKYYAWEPGNFAYDWLLHVAAARNAHRQILD